MPAPQGVEVTPYLVPAVRQIAAITNAFPAVVTTTFAHGYITGGIIRFYIPVGFGMRQVNKRKGSIEVLSDTTFSIDVDTTLFDTFTIPAYVAPPAPYSIAACVPVGEDNDTFQSAFMNILTPLF